MGERARTPIDMESAVPVAEWPLEVDEPVELLIEHANAKWSQDPVGDGWIAWCAGSWTDFNGGGWTWNGLCGRVTYVRPKVDE